MIRVRRPSARVLVLVVSTIGIGCGSRDAEPSDEGAEGTLAETTQAITESEVIARAKLWLDAEVPYCGGVNGGSDALCGGTCNRPSAAWDDYRTDCSGFVSWSWGLPAPGWVTSTFYGNIGGSVLQLTVSDLKPGDAFVTFGTGHIILFRRWIVPNQRMEIWEESTCGGVAHSEEHTIAIESPTKFYIDGDSRAYTPIRHTQLVHTNTPHGYLDGADCDRVHGWSQDDDVPTSPIDVHVYFNGPAGAGNATGVSVHADLSRQDLCDAIGSCEHAFSVPSPLSLHDGTAHEVHAYGIDNDGTDNSELDNSPMQLKCAPSLPSGVRREVPASVFSAWQFDPFWHLLPAPAASVDTLENWNDLPSAPVLIQVDGEAAVWLVDGTWRRHVPSPSVAHAWNLDLGSVHKVTSAELASYEEGTSLRERPVLAKGSDGQTYLVDDKQQSPGAPDAGSEDAGASESEAGGGDGGLTADSGTDGGTNRPPAGTYASQESGSCSVGMGAAKGTAATGLWLALGAMAWRRRRRSRRAR